MCARAYQARLALDLTQHGEQPFARAIVIEPRIEGLIHPARSLYRGQCVEAKTRLLDLWLNLVGTMEVGGGEPVGPVREVLVNATRQATVDHGGEFGIAKRTVL